MEKILELTKQHIEIMNTKNILISIYTSATGFLWQLMKVDSGTDLGYSEDFGNDEWSGSFKTYADCLEDAITLINKCDLEQFQKEYPKSKFHWSLYSNHLNNKYR